MKGSVPRINNGFPNLFMCGSTVLTCTIHTEMKMDRNSTTVHGTPLLPEFLFLLQQPATQQSNKLTRAAA